MILFTIKIFLQAKVIASNPVISGDLVFFVVKPWTTFGHSS